MPNLHQAVAKTCSSKVFTETSDCQKSGSTQRLVEYRTSSGTTGRHRTNPIHLGQYNPESLHIFLDGVLKPIITLLSLGIVATYICYLANKVIAKSSELTCQWRNSNGHRTATVKMATAAPMAADGVTTTWQASTVARLTSPVKHRFINVGSTSNLQRRLQLMNMSMNQISLYF